MLSRGSKPRGEAVRDELPYYVDEADQDQEEARTQDTAAEGKETTWRGTDGYISQSCGILTSR